MEIRDLILEGIIPLVGMLLSFASVILIVFVVSKSRQRRLEIQADISSKLIDKFGSTGELAAFLQSEVGQEFVRGVQTAGERHVADRAQSAVRNGILFTALGLGFLVLLMITGTRGLAWPGVILLMLGVSYFGSAYSMLRFHDIRSRRSQSPSEV